VTAQQATRTFTLIPGEKKGRFLWLNQKSKNQGKEKVTDDMAGPVSKTRISMLRRTSYLAIVPGNRDGRYSIVKDTVGDANAVARHLPATDGC
jgi:hypothetical protein